MSDRLEFKNESTGVIGVVKLNADQKPEGIPLHPGRTVVLSRREAELTAEAPADPKNNPFIERKVRRLDPETDEEVTETQPAPLQRVKELDGERVTLRPVPAFDIEGVDPYEEEFARQRESEDEVRKDRERAQAAAAEAPDAEELEQERLRLQEEREAAERERQELAAERQRLEAARAGQADVDEARKSEQEAARRAEQAAAEQRRVAAQASQVVAPASVPSPVDSAPEPDDPDTDESGNEVIHENLKVADYEAASPEQIAGFVKNADRDYAAAVLEHERANANREEVVTAAESRVAELDSGGTGDTGRPGQPTTTPAPGSAPTGQ